MSQQAESTERGLPRRFTSLVTYNDNHPDAAFPPSPAERDALRRFDAAGTGIEDDIVDRGMLLTIDFLPGGAPAADELDRVGSVVASCWGKAPVYLLAEHVSLRAAWRTISAQWPTSLSAVQSALVDLRRYGGRP
ncbi:hypothetical protein [Mycolicibacterium setense]